MINLDDLNVYKRMDPQGMGDRIAEIGQQIDEARKLVASFPHPGPEFARAMNILILGMGGSAIGADLVRALVEGQSTVPILVSRDYRVPGFVGPETLAIASSHSGDTEETLSATEDALQRGAKVIVMTTGGKLAQMARERNLPILHFQSAAQPRAALGFSFGLLLGLLGKLGYVDEALFGMDEAVAMARSAPLSLGPDVPTDVNPAKQMALRIQGKLPVIYGGGILSEVARRWKGQFNENAKAWSYFEQLPELNHNAVAGYENPPDLAGNLYVILLASFTNHPRVAARVRITAQVLQQKGVMHQVVDAQGNSPVAQMINSILIGDYASYYLALLYGSDPTPVRLLDFFKAQLAAI